MTTVIIDRENRTIYADKKVTYGLGGAFGTCSKLYPFKFRGGNNAVFAESGTSGEAQYLLHLLRSKCKSIEGLFDLDKKERDQLTKLDCLVVIPKTNATYSIMAGGFPVPVTDNYWSVGAGWEMALVLMDAGLRPEQIFPYIAARTPHTSAEFDFIKY